MGNLLSLFGIDWNSSPTLQQADNLRTQATQSKEAASNYSTQSQAAFTAKNHSLAKDLSEKKKAAYSLADSLDKEAARAIFKHYNHSRDRGTIDLHGLYAAEAEDFVTKRLVKCKARKITTLVIITGQGNNSKDHKAILKPRIEKYAMDNGILHEMDKPNPGCITLTMDDNSTHHSCSIQ